MEKLQLQLLGPSEFTWDLSPIWQEIQNCRRIDQEWKSDLFTLGKFTNCQLVLHPRGRLSSTPGMAGIALIYTVEKSNPFDDRKRNSANWVQFQFGNVKLPTVSSPPTPLTPYDAATDAAICENFLQTDNLLTSDLRIISVKTVAPCE